MEILSNIVYLINSIISDSLSLATGKEKPDVIGQYRWVYTFSNRFRVFSGGGSWILDRALKWTDLFRFYLNIYPPSPTCVPTWIRHVFVPSLSISVLNISSIILKCCEKSLTPLASAKWLHNPIFWCIFEYDFVRKSDIYKIVYRFNLLAPYPTIILVIRFGSLSMYNLNSFRIIKIILKASPQ